MVQAQTPSLTPDQLAAQLLPKDALPGWTAAGDISTTINSNGTANTNGTASSADSAGSDTGAQLTLAERIFKPTDGDKAIVAVALLAPPSGTNLSALSTALQDGTLMQQLATAATQGSLANFMLTGTQGIGDQDQSATFTGTLNGTSQQLASVIWVRNGEIGVTIFGADASQIDAQTALSEAVDAAQLQDSMLQSSATSPTSTA